jgi:hypothetical protein
MNRTLPLLTLVCAGLLAGCSVGLGARIEGGGGARYFNPGPGAKVVVNEDLEFNAISDQARTIPTGAYAVVRTERRYAPLAAFEPVQVASLGLTLAQFHPGGSPTINDIRSFNCAQWGEPGSIDTYPTLDEIATALGEAARMEL